jgi:hypothetical protein
MTDQEQKVANEEAEAKEKALQELQRAYNSGEYKEPLELLEWIKSQESTPPTLKAEIKKQMTWYELESGLEPDDDDGQEDFHL